jgi:HEAT repeat protein
VRLKTLYREPDGVADIVAIGERAIPALKTILFTREPSGLYQVRCRAIEALGRLGAFDVLEEFLRRPGHMDPVERLGDDVVAGAAARVIAQRKDQGTFDLLCELAAAHPLNGVMAALASFERPEAIPVLISALEEDEVRLSAETALSSFGPAARPLLLDAVDRFTSGNALSESHLRKCRSILALLDEIDLDPSDMERLRPLMRSADMQVSLLACRIALHRGSETMRSDARARLICLRRSTAWPERSQIDHYLASIS